MKRVYNMFQEFKKFILRGNVVDLAVAVVIGAAFTTVVNAFVADLLTPLISAFQGRSDFSQYTFSINGSQFRHGHFINTLISFLLTAGVVFFLVVQPLNRLMELSRRKEQTGDPTTQKCPECLSEIPDKARRCKFCTAVIKQAEKAKA